MDNSQVNASEWVDGRMATLEPARQWQPNATRALARVKARKVRRFRFMWASAAAAASISMCLLFMMAQPACAAPVCIGFLKPAAVNQPAPLNYKESGSPTARVTIEIYSDYECPMCAVMFRDTVPQLVAQYVQPGKVRLIHRDFPLPQHTHSRLATRYVNASGTMGYYDTVVAQIFKTQDVWSKNGDVDGQVTQVLPPGVMQKVRQLVKSDAKLDDTVTTDVEMGRQDHVSGTPTVVVVANGKRQSLPSLPSFSLLKAYIDQLLSK